jgi:hypothetical protein
MPASGAGIFASPLVLLFGGHRWIAIAAYGLVLIPALLLYRMFHEALAAGRGLRAWCLWLTVDLPAGTDDLEEGR